MKEFGQKAAQVTLPAARGSSSAGSRPVCSPSRASLVSLGEHSRYSNMEPSAAPPAQLAGAQPAPGGSRGKNSPALWMRKFTTSILSK